MCKRKGQRGAEKIFEEILAEIEKYFERNEKENTVYQNKIRGEIN